MVSRMKSMVYMSLPDTCALHFQYIPSYHITQAYTGITQASANAHTTETTEVTEL